jgi:hypothetical protein
VRLSFSYVKGWVLAQQEQDPVINQLRNLESVILASVFTDTDVDDHVSMEDVDCDAQLEDLKKRIEFKEESWNKYQRLFSFQQRSWHWLYGRSFTQLERDQVETILQSERTQLEVLKCQSIPTSTPTIKERIFGSLHWIVGDFVLFSLHFCRSFRLGQVRKGAGEDEGCLRRDFC